MKMSIKQSILMFISLILGYVGFVAIFIAASMGSNEKSIGVMLVILLPAGLFFILSIVPTISTGMRVLITLSASAIGGALLIAIDFYSVEAYGSWGFLTNLLSVWSLLANLLLACLAIYFIFASIFYVLRINKAGFVRSLIAFFILTLSVGTSVGLQFARLDFYWRLPKYNAVIQLVKNGKLVPDSYGNAYAPPEYDHIGVDIMNDSGEQSFYFRSGGLIQGYLYSDTNKIPKSFDCKKIAGVESWFDCIDRG